MRNASWIALFAALGAATADASVITQLLGGTGTPPTIFGIPLQPFPLDPRPVLQNVTTITGPTGDIQLSHPCNHRRVGMGWSQWGLASRTIRPDLYYTNGWGEITLFLPPQTRLFSIYFTPDSGGTTFTVRADGVQTVTTPWTYWSYSSPAGVALVATEGRTISSVTIDGGRGFAFGEIFISTQPYFPATLYVDQKAPPGGDGSRWERALNDLQIALQQAQPGTEIRVAGGVYKPASPGSRDRAFMLRTATRLVGGFAGYGHPAPDTRGPQFETVLSGDLLGDDQPDFVARDDNSRTVISISQGIAFGSTVLRDLTIRSGHNDYQSPGAAGLVSQLPVDLANCTFEEHLATGAGASGAAYLRISDAHVSLHDCRFRNNRAIDGAAMQFYVGAPEGFVDMQRCDFRDNAAVVSGGACRVEWLVGTLRWADCTFTRNRAFRGGAVCVQSRMGSRALFTIRMTACTFISNEAEIGGALAVREADGPLLIDRTRWLGNSALSEGGAIHLDDATAVILNSHFAGNSAGDGGALLVEPFPPDSLRRVLLYHSTLTDNRAAYIGGGLLSRGSRGPSVRNTIFWGNQDAQSLREAAQITGPLAGLDYSCIEGLSGRYGGVGNIGLDPRLYDRDGLDDVVGTLDDNPQLAPGSPVIDQGDPTMSLSAPGTLAPIAPDGPPRRDLDRQARIWNGENPGLNASDGAGPPARIDIGADEFGSHSFGDLNCDGLVDFRDIDGFVLALVGSAPYFASYPDCAVLLGDMTGEGAVDFGDLDQFVAALIASP